MLFPKSPLLALGLLTATSVWAGSPMIPQPLAPSAHAQSGATAFKPEPKLRLPSPKITATRLVRQADGSLRMQCDEIPNPRARIALPARPLSPNAPVQQ